MTAFFRLYFDAYKGLSKAAWLLALVMLINRTGSMVIPFLGLYMADELGFSKTEIGIVLGCFGLGSVLGSWLGGWLTDKFGNFNIQVASLAIVAPLFVLTSFIKSFEGLAVAIFVLTLAADIFRPANSVSIASYAKPENITRAYSLNRMAVNLGFSIGPALGGFLASYSYALIFYVNAFAVLAALVVFYSFFKNRKTNELQFGQQQEKTVDQPKRNAYKDVPFIFFNIACFLFALSFFQLLSTLPLFYKEARELSQLQIGFVLGSNGLVIVIFEMVAVHYLERKLDTARILFLGALFSATSFGLLLLDWGYLWLFVPMFMLSFGEMLVFPFTSTISIKRAGPNNQGAYMGFNSLAFGAANIFSPYLSTYTAEHFDYSTLWIASGFILVVVSFAFYWTTNMLDKNHSQQPYPTLRS